MRVPDWGEARREGQVVRVREGGEAWKPGTALRHPSHPSSNADKHVRENKRRSVCACEGHHSGERERAVFVLEQN